MDEIMWVYGYKIGLIGMINMKIGDEIFEVKNIILDVLIF